MHYTLVQSVDAKYDCILVGFLSHTLPKSFTKYLRKDQNQILNSLAKRLDKTGQTFEHQSITGPSFIALNCGGKKDFNTNTFIEQFSHVVSKLVRYRSVCIVLPDVTTWKESQKIKQIILTLEEARYQFVDYKSQKEELHPIKNCAIWSESNKSQAAIKEARAIAKGMNSARLLADLPANICTPTYLADHAFELASQSHYISSTVLTPEEMAALKMNALLAVGQGSREPARFIELQYAHSEAEAVEPIILIGKGITFDAGGISLKKPPGMNEMKFDMAGAASVFGTIEAIAQLDLPLNVTGLIPCAENLPGGHAYKPGDIITSMSGQTIEITNTDAEGRLILADSLAYARQFKPKYVIDIATLTGAMVVSLGHVFNGLISTSDPLANLIMRAANLINDKTWRLPLDPAFDKAMDSNVADMINASFEPKAGSLTAASFLGRFAKNLCWAHLDIAGTAWVPGKNSKATGRPVPLLVQFLQLIAKKLM